MLVLIVRTLFLYLLIVLAMRIMGKRQIGEMQPSELVVAIMISDLASVPMQGIDVPLLSGIVPVLTLLIGEVTMSFICLKNKTARRYITGEPSILVYKGHINEGELERLRFNLNDLIEQMRLSGYPDISKVQVAVLETNGQLSVIEKGDLEELPYVLIADGELNKNELKRSGKDEKWLKEQLPDKIRSIFIAVLNDSGELYVQKKGEKDKA